jgi:hypothetical protein
MTTLCDLARKLPHLVGTLLDQEAKLKKGRFREETLTDVVTAALAAFAGPSMIIEYPDEAVTGGDLDLDFWHVSTGSRLQIRIQAKRLNAEEANNKPIAIKHRAYNELLHVVPSTNAYQFETLINSAGSFLPLYMFYNHESVVQDHYFSGMTPAVCGINLAFAHDIANELSAKIKAQPKRLHHKRLSHLRPHFFDLTAIFCSSVSPGDDVPSPDNICTSLQQRWKETADSRKQPVAAGQVLSPIFKPEGLVVSRGGRPRPADGPAIRINRGVERPTVIFISGRTTDKNTPKISG